MNTKLCDKWGVLGTPSSVGGYIHLITESDDTYTSDTMLVLNTDGTMSITNYPTPVVINKDDLLADDISEEQYRRICKLSLQAREAKSNAFDNLMAVMGAAKDDYQRTTDEIDRDLYKLTNFVIGDNGA